MTPAAKQSRASSGGRRRNARLAAVQALYQIELSETPADAPERIERVIRDFARYRLDQDVEGSGSARPTKSSSPTSFAARPRGGPRSMPSSPAASPPNGRSSASRRSSARSCVPAATRLLARPDVPARVVISEYLEVAHAFFGGKEPALVNGVLDRVARQLRETEFAR